MRKYIHIVSEILELAAALLVLAGILIAGAGLILNRTHFSELFHDVSYFREYLEQIFTLVIGMEFLQMLCKPNSDNVLETLIFLVARHMIIGETNPYQDFVSVISIALLCILRRYLHNSREARLHPHSGDAEPKVGEEQKKCGILNLIKEIEHEM